MPEHQFQSLEWRPYFCPPEALLTGPLDVLVDLKPYSESLPSRTPSTTGACHLCEAKFVLSHMETEGEQILLESRADHRIPFSRGHSAQRPIALASISRMNPQRLRMPVKRVGEQWRSSNRFGRESLWTGRENALWPAISICKAARAQRSGGCIWQTAPKRARVRSMTHSNYFPRAVLRTARGQRYFR